MLRNKSLTELRGIAQSFGVADIFTKDQLQLIQAIELRQQDMQPTTAPIIPKPEYDARLMTRPPAKRSEVEVAEELLAPYVERGLHLRFDEERWYMSYSGRTDEGTLRMPLRVLMKCADNLMRPTGKSYQCAPKDGAA